MTLYVRVLRASALCSGLALAACSTARVPAPTAAPPAPAVAEGIAPEGLYKIGKPYQVDGIWYYPSEDYNYHQEGIASWYGQDFQGKRTANGERYDMNSLTAAHPTLPLPSVVKVTNLDNGRVVELRVNDRGPYKSNRIIDVSRRAAQLLGFYDVGTAHVRVEIDPTESLNVKNLALREHPPEMPQIAAAPHALVSESALETVVATPSDLAGAHTAQIPPTAAPTPDAPPSKTAGAKNKAAAPAPKVASNGPMKPAKANPGPAIGGGIFIQAGAFSDVANAHRLEQQLKEFGSVLVLPVTVNNAPLYRVRVGPVASEAAAYALLNRVRSFGYDDAQVVRY